MKKQSHQRFLGFTMLELMVVVVLIAGLMAIVIPALSSIAGADVKNEVTRMIGLTQEVYARAAISGITHRINIDLDNQNYWVEVKEGEAGTIAPEMGYEELMNVLITKSKKEAENAFEYQYVPHYKEVSGPLGEKSTLEKNIVFHGAWTEQMPEVARTGIVSIYFFSGGYTQASFVSLAQKGDQEDTSIYVALSPLTGAASTNQGEPNIKDLLEGEGEKEK
jgi:prepilin-type N-terminal cleavage/methylation domain-containing protein